MTLVTWFLTGLILIAIWWDKAKQKEGKFGLPGVRQYGPIATAVLFIITGLLIITSS